MKNIYTGKTRLFLCISGAIIVIALILQIVGVGLNLGIDFTGGSLLNYSVGEDYDVADVETILASAGYEGGQVTKAAPSDASIALQAELAQAQQEAAQADEAAVESGEAHVHEDGTVHYGDHEDEAEAEAEEAEVEVSEPMLNPDKSGVKADGLTDLQIRLNLVDETASLEDAVVAAVKGALPAAEQSGYVELTNSVIVNKGLDATLAGGYAVEFSVGEEFDKEAVRTAVEAALAENFSVAEMSVQRYDAAAEAEAEAAAESAAAEAEAGDETAEAEAAEETEAVEETEEVEETGTDLRVLVKLDDEATQVRALLEKEMTAKYPNFRFVSVDHVSAIAGRDLLSNAVKALLIAFACMLVYIAIRFDVFSGLAALFGLLHDVLIMCSFMVFFRGLYQVNSSFIAAVLTIVGYSINNTIIIFDRIRETAKKPGWSDRSRKEVVEVSVSNTLSRTINTSLTTLITLVALYVFGVESIREFAFPLIVGMLAGTYSSVLLSGQVWAMWVDRHEARKAAKKA